MGPDFFSIKPIELNPITLGPGACWRALFVNSVVTTQFPTQRRRSGVGVALFPYLIAALAGIIAPAEFQGGLILKDLSTTLMPMKRLDDEEAIQWHLAVTNRLGDTLQSLLPGSSESLFEFYKTHYLELLLNARGYLGRCRHVTILPGTSVIIRVYFG